RKTFYDMERDTIKWCAHHIFLNEFSKNVFIDLYTIKRQKSFASSVIPLPIELPVLTTSNKTTRNKEAAVNIGMVARWDSIKNHSALLRLAQSAIRPKNWTIHSVVAVNASRSDFAKEYVNSITIVEPMPPEKLTRFYEAMDVILLPSNFDVSPTVAAEALLVGKPVIISDQVGWVNDFITVGLKDHVISPNISGTALVNTIRDVVSAINTNSKKYATLVKQIRYDHEPKRVFTEYASVFNSVVNNL
ncbi:glycosyltransferase, partial [Patescibacteria group bacterium]|nr:glycosyltransferase [Patescibacteria group bacterium]